MPGVSVNHSQTCPQCQANLPSDAAFCPECGTATATSEVEQVGVPTFGGLQTLAPLSAGPTGSGQFEILEPGTRLADRYVIENQIGIGGMGVVYKASDEISQETVAIKVLHPNQQSGDSASKRLKQEGLTARNIRQKNVVSIYDIGEANGQPFVSMEYLEGKSLRRWQREWQESGKSIPAHLVFQVIHQVLLGLQAAHEEGVVHRDLKPENVMVVSADENEIFVKILDFGIARIGKAEPQAMGALGTRGYMAPEQLTHPDLAKPSADLFSLSTIFYELLADVIPQGHWQPPSVGRNDIPHGIDQLIEQGLSNRPANRIQDAGVYLNELRRLAGNEQVSTVDAQLASDKVDLGKWGKSKSQDQSKTLVIVFCVIGFFVVMLFFVVMGALLDMNDNSGYPNQPGTTFEQQMDSFDFNPPPSGFNPNQIENW